MVVNGGNNSDGEPAVSGRDCEETTAVAMMVVHCYIVIVGEEKVMGDR
jgi:hypothetical protein